MATKPDLSYIAPDLRALAVPCGDLVLDAANARLHNDANTEAVRQALIKYGQRLPIVAHAETKVVTAGNLRLQLHQSLGYDYIAVVWHSDDEADTAEFAVLDNRIAELGHWDYQALAVVLETLEAEDRDLSVFQWSDDEMARIMATLEDEPALPDPDTDTGGPVEGQPERTKLADRFGVPPFTVLDARQGYWQERKRAWLAMGIESELGRGITDASGNYRSSHGVYDPQMGHTQKINGKEPATIGGAPLPLDRSKRIKGKKPARCFGQDLMRGEHVVGENGQHVQGVLMTSDSGNDPAYYDKKRAMEQALGRTLDDRGVPAGLLHGPRYVSIGHFDLRSSAVRADLPVVQSGRWAGGRSLRRRQRARGGGGGAGAAVLGLRSAARADRGEPPAGGPDPCGQRWCRLGGR
jgi:ParB-like chromosome segregation protein Spo0J